MTEIGELGVMASGLEPTTGPRQARDGFAQLLDLPAAEPVEAAPQLEGEATARVVELLTSEEIAVPMRLLATGHLAYQADAGVAYAAPVALVVGISTASAATLAPTAPSAPQTHHIETAAAVTMAPLPVRTALAALQRSATVAPGAVEAAAVAPAPVAQTARYLRRRLQAIAAPDGLRLLVRDFGLGLRARGALVADLVARLRGLPLQQIIVNGATVWRDAAPRGAPQE